MKRKTCQAIGKRLRSAQAPEDVAIRGLQEHAEKLVRILLHDESPEKGYSTAAAGAPQRDRFPSRHMMSRMPLTECTAREVEVCPSIGLQEHVSARCTNLCRLHVCSDVIRVPWRHEMWCQGRLTPGGP